MAVRDPVSVERPALEGIRNVRVVPAGGRPWPDGGEGHQVTEYLHESLLLGAELETDAAAPVQSPGRAIRYVQTVPERGTRSEIR